MHGFFEPVRSLRLVRVISALAAGLVAAGAHAQVPHTFASGTPAKAAEVNANFAHLAQGVAEAKTSAAAAAQGVTEAKAGVTALAERVVPVGAVMAFAGTTAPAGWLLCDGAAVSRTTYAALFEVLGVSHGNGDQIATFNVPDYRGRFLRGTDGGAGRDPDRNTRTAMGVGGAAGDAVGSVQNGQFTSHAHGYTDPGHRHTFGVETSGGWNGSVVQGSDRAANSWNATDYVPTGITILASGGSETRPVNAGVNYIIKY